MKNYSPWLEQLKKNRPIKSLSKDLETDVAIVGGGIAGISSAFFILKNTNQKVALLEGSRIAHGATGHNAGQITNYFERPFHELVEEFGLEMASVGQKNIENAWSLLDEMYTDGGLNIPISRFTGHLGLSSRDQVERLLADNLARKDGGLTPEEFLISSSAKFLEEIDSKYKTLYQVVDHETILSRLETPKKEFIAAVSAQKGCVNSALFTEEVALYLLAKYAERFEICENTRVQKIVLHDESALLDTELHTVKASRIILCTNGFEHLRIFNKSGLDIDTNFHHAIHGTVGYMSGYLENLNKAPTAISYFTEADSFSDFRDTDFSSVDPYFYLTRRQYEHIDRQKYNLISVGGPEIGLQDRRGYRREEEYPEEAKRKINDFIKETYDIDPNKKIEYIFTWHGLMGYTPSGVRLIGPEPKNPILFYNLGCNGVGILPSIFGGEKISRIIAGEKFPESIFDPR